MTAAPAPRLVRGLAVLTTPDALIVDGPPTRKVFTGAAATGLLPPLLERMDGTRDLDALAAATGRTPAEVTRALRLLDRSGVVEWISPGTPDTGLDTAADAYLSRSLAVTRRHADVASVTAALAAARTVVLGAGPLADAVVTGLHEAGVTRARRSDGVPEGPQDLVVDCGTPPGTHAGELWRRGVPVLRVAAGAARLDLGPLLHPRWTDCPDCWSRAAGPPPGGDLPGDADDLAAGLIVAEAVAILSAITPPSTLGRAVRLDLAELSEEILVFGPEPGCDRCANGVAADGLEALHYERAAAWNPWSAPPGGSVDAVSRIRYAYEASPKVDADRVPGCLRALLAAADTVDDVDVYVLGAAGLPYPVYLYEPATGQLVATRASADPVPSGLPGTPDAVLVLVATPFRAYPVHGPDSWRRGLLRAGATLARMERAAPGVRLAAATRFDPGLRDLLELRADQEAPAVAVGVYRETADAVDD